MSRRVKHLTVFSSRLEQEIDGVIDLLTKAGWTIDRHNLCEYPERYAVTFHQETEYRGRCFWLHSIGHFTTERSLTGLARDVSLKECSGFWEGVWTGIPTSKWLNCPDKIRTASNKLYQLQRARSLNLNVPPWLVSNCSEEIGRFLAAQGDVVLKSLVSGFVAYGRESFKFYTRRATPTLIARLKQAQFAPIIVQKRIHKRFEIRATVVADEVFCSMLDYSKLPAVTDYRTLDFTRYRDAFSKCPRRIFAMVAAHSVNIAREFGLCYAGIDWIIDESEHPFFLEINPLASFKWYELCGAGNITGALADRLVQTEHGNR